MLCFRNDGQHIEILRKDIHQNTNSGYNAIRQFLFFYALFSILNIKSVFSWS